MKYFMYIYIVVTIFTSCKPIDERRCFKKTGDIISIIHANRNAHKVVMNDDIALTLVQDSLDYIEIIGGENMLPFVEMSSANGVITFNNNNRCNFTRKLEPITVIYHCTTVDSILLNGYGKLSNVGTYKSDLYIATEESFSSIEMNLDNEYTTIVGQVGSIDAVLTGKCNHLYMYSNGSGFMDASQLNCLSSHGHSQGIGDFYLSASQLIIAELRSKGNFILTNSQSATKEISDEGEGTILYK